jgi:hypothetical protein
MPRAEISGWLEEGQELVRTVPVICPKCGKKLWKTDASRLIGIIVVGCKDSRCRWCEIYDA